MRRWKVLNNLYAYYALGVILMAGIKPINIKERAYVVNRSWTPSKILSRKNEKETFRVEAHFSESVNHRYIRQPYEQTFRELQRLTDAGSFGLNINYYSYMFAEWG